MFFYHNNLSIITEKERERERERERDSIVIKNIFVLL